MNRDRQRPNQDNEDSEEVLKAYWRKYAEAFAVPLSANTMLGNFVANPAVTGAYAEVWVRRLVRIDGDRTQAFDGRRDPYDGYPEGS